jgi:hypothetical protein
MVEVPIGKIQVERVAFDELHPAGDARLRGQPASPPDQLRRQIHADDADITPPVGDVHRVLPAAAADVEYARSGRDPPMKRPCRSVSSTLNTPGAM